VINVSQTGNLNWQKVLGGTDADYANAIITDKNNNYIIGGISYSSDGDVSGAKGKGDYWIVTLSPSGNLVWKKNWGGSQIDNLRCIIEIPARNEYYLCGDTESGNGDFNSGKGKTDFGIIKLKIPALQLKDSIVCSTAGFSAAPDTLKDVCGYDSVFVKYRAVAIGSPFNLIQKSDTIFTGQSITLPSNGNGDIVWNAHPTLSCTNCPNPVATPTATTIYTATNSLAADCSISDDFTVVVLADALVQVPTAFTPNGDGRNDYFGPLGKVPSNYSMQIFNRNGETVFKSSSMESRWNGIYKGIIQESSVFIYLISYIDIQNMKHQQKGTFVLIR